MNKRTFASNVKLLRKEQGLTQDQLAKKLSVGRARIGAWEEQRAWPNIPLLVKISDYFDVDLYRLLTEKFK